MKKQAEVVQNFKKTSDKVIKIYYNDKGESFKDTASLRGICCARVHKVVKDNSSIEKFYVVIDKNGKLYNPQEYTYSKHIRFKEKSVSEKCLDLYIGYLGTKKELFYRQAAREAIS